MLIKVWFALVLLWTSVNSYKILVALPTTFKSHYQFGSEISKALAAEGHEVTVISPFKQAKPLPNYDEVHLEHTVQATKNIHYAYSNMDTSALSIFRVLRITMEFRDAITVSLRNSENLKQFLRNATHFDAILVETLFCAEIIGLGHHFNAPVISISPLMESTEYSFGHTATPAMKSFTPSTLNSYTEKMSFGQRMHTFLTYLGAVVLPSPFRWPGLQRNYELLFSDSTNLPSLRHLMRNISLILINSHPAITSPRLFMPNIIEIGGAVIQPERIQALPKDVDRFLSEATSGAVYFSLGSIVNITQIPTQQKMAILNVFKELSNVKFLVKGNDELATLFKSVPNVLIRSWFPQKTILKHRNLKCFVTHGGLNSIQESIYYGKPVVVVPFFLDQLTNARWAHENGYGIELPFYEMTQNSLKIAITNVLLNPSYTHKAQITSDLFRDRIVPPMQTAIFWIKYVAATKGAPHLHSLATHFDAYHYYNLDVWAFFILIYIAVILVLWKVLAKTSLLIKSMIMRRKRKIL